MCFTLLFFLQENKRQFTTACEQPPIHVFKNRSATWPWSLLLVRESATYYRALQGTFRLGFLCYALLIRLTVCLLLSVSAYLSAPWLLSRVVTHWTCRFRWVPGEWLKCSKTCGEGIQIRNLRCKQLIDENGAQKDKMLPIKSCPHWSRPQGTRPCKNAPCPVPSKWTSEEWEQVRITKEWKWLLRHLSVLNVVLSFLLSWLLLTVCSCFFFFLLFHLFRLHVLSFPYFSSYCNFLLLRCKPYISVICFSIRLVFCDLWYRHADKKSQVCQH